MVYGLWFIVYGRLEKVSGSGLRVQGSDLGVTSTYDILYSMFYDSGCSVWNGL
jgi:hypothetical protein